MPVTITDDKVCILPGVPDMSDDQKRLVPHFVTDKAGALWLICSENDCTARLRRMNNRQAIDITRPYYCLDHAMYSQSEAGMFDEEITAHIADILNDKANM